MGMLWHWSHKNLLLGRPLCFSTRSWAIGAWGGGRQHAFISVAWRERLCTAWERRSRAAHLLILDGKVQGDGHGKAPEGNIQRSPSRESEAQVVILLVLRPLLNCRVAVTRVPKGCERVGEGREAHMRGVRVERGRCSRTPAHRLSRCTTITTTKTHFLAGRERVTLVPD